MDQQKELPFLRSAVSHTPVQVAIEECLLQNRVYKPAIKARVGGEGINGRHRCQPFADILVDGGVVEGLEIVFREQWFLTFSAKILQSLCVVLRAAGATNEMSHKDYGNGAQT